MKKSFLTATAALLLAVLCGATGCSNEVDGATVFTDDERAAFAASNAETGLGKNQQEDAVEQTARCIDPVGGQVGYAPSK